MSEHSNNNSGGNPNGNPNGNPGAPNPNRRPNNRRRHNNNNRSRDGVQGQTAGQDRPLNSNQAPRQGQGQPQGQPQDQRRPQHPNQQNNNPNQKRKPQHNNNRPRPQGQGGAHQPVNTNSTGFNVERVYEKYLNLLDQHIIARRKYHDLFYRADPAQKNKLERNFYNTINDIREFESKLAPDVKVLFEKRNNGYQYDRTYTSNHEIPVEGDTVPDGLPPAEPHYLQSQIAADFKEDVEESVGTAEDYLKYKGF